ncbi:MAG: FAD-dependent oxidoreductase [Proteobacteria bacterium]|nr:FAD-dependent oxidoreductase [Pseudomonadota bacterium]
MNSVWMADHRDSSPYPPLAGTVEADTVVIGGGITGVTTAMLLAGAGQSVVLLEAERIGASNTGGSTGNLYGTVSDGLAKLRDKWDADTARQVVTMRMQALELIEKTSARLSIDCGFARRPLYACVAGDDEQQLASLQDEHRALEEAGLAPSWVDAVPGLPASALPPRAHAALRIEQQAQFNPFTYVQGLARALAGQGVRVHEHSAAVDVDAGAGRVKTAAGEVHAKHIVFATHTPKGFNLVQAEMETYREYGIAGALDAAPGQGRAPEAICWIRDRSRSIRSCRHGDRDHLVVVGEKHKTGHNAADTDYHERLREYAREHFGVSSFDYAWSAQQYKSADALPYIGHSAHRNVYMATGFGADGLTWGTVAANVIAELVQGRESPASELLTPKRFTPIKSAKVWAAENATVMKHLVGDRLSSAEQHRLSDVQRGQGRIVDLDGRKHAVYRSPADELTVLSPVCPHLKCHVAWNAAATSWDCPCHGSRFDIHGQVIEGPSLHPLERYELED